MWIIAGIISIVVVCALVAGCMKLARAADDEEAALWEDIQRHKKEKLP